MSANIVALSGGVGGAKLAFGLSLVLEKQALAVIANTADDFEHLGLKICPDIDTLIYTLSERNNPITGWGRRDETWSFMASVKELVPESWFSLGDQDLAVHVWRTWQLSLGRTLSDVTKELAGVMNAPATVIPMSDDSVQTMLDTDLGMLEFQDYFVRRQCEPRVNAVGFAGAERARPSPAFAQLLSNPQIDGFIICPSNPYLSIDPILSIPGVTEALKRHRAPVIAVSPIVGGDSLKGPTSKMMGELKIPCSVSSIANHYHGLIDLLFIDNTDADQKPALLDQGVEVAVANIVMENRQNKVALAETILALF